MTYDAPLIFIPVMMFIVLLIIGFIMLKLPPKEINSLYGYRSKTSMANQEIWDYAQKKSAKMMMMYGVLHLPFCALTFVVHDENWATVIALIVLITLTVIMLLHTERIVKRKFNQMSTK